MEDDNELHEVGELIRKISDRPRSFVGSEDFLRAAAYVEGFSAGRGYVNTLQDPGAIFNFGFWLAEELGRPRNWAWFAIIKDVYEDDARALEMLPLLFGRFTDSGGSRSS